MSHRKLRISVDIYGEDDNEYAVPLNDEADEELEESAQSVKEEYEPDKLLHTEGNSTRTNSDSKPAKQPSSKTAGASSTNSATATASSPAQSDRSLPVKPRSPTSSAMSYSAQIAQQFSAYQQTPSQERQQRLPSSKIATHEGPLGDSVFGKKPSEMHDAG